MHPSKPILKKSKRKGKIDQFKRKSGNKKKNRNKINSTNTASLMVTKRRLQIA